MPSLTVSSVPGSITATRYFTTRRSQTSRSFSAFRTLLPESWRVPSLRDHITPVLKDLHWLPVQQRIEYKVALVTHKVLATGQPPGWPKMQNAGCGSAELADV